MLERLSVVELAEGIARREFSPLEVVEAFLARIDRVNPQVNAFVAVYAGQARQEARRLTELAARGEIVGPLHGVPLTVKDSFDVAGEPTLCGSRLRLGHRAHQDAVAVARLRRAGAIILGKTNCPEFLMNYETDNSVTGRTNNPWDLSRTCGGSSGGEAAAIASCCSPGGLGSDGGGSIRFPAHCCGITGLKPTPGRVPAAGHFPEILHPGGLLGVAGPMARTAADVARLFQVVSGYDWRDPFSSPVPLRSSEARALKIGLMEQFCEVPVGAPVLEAVRRATRLLADLGHLVEPFQPAGIERAPEVWRFFFIELAAVAMRPLIEKEKERMHWTGLELFLPVLEQPEPQANRILEMFATRDRLRNRILAQMEEFPVLLWPGAGVTAFSHRQRVFPTPKGTIDYAQATIPLVPANILGLPAVAIPMTLSAEGLPVGIQLIGRPYEEERLLALAQDLEQARGPFPLPLQA